MMRLAVSVEGPTEREFVNRVLKPHLLQAGWDLVRPISLYGGVSLHRVKAELRLLSGQFERVTTLYDLYGFAARDGRDANQIEAAIRDAAGNVPDLVAYVQQHEFEALLFSDVEAIAAEFPERSRGILQLQKARTEFGGPEDINGGFDTCPSRRLKMIFPTYDKVRHGALLAEKIGLDRIKQECPRFANWLRQLEPSSPLRQ